MSCQFLLHDQVLGILTLIVYVAEQIPDDLDMNERSTTSIFVGKRLLPQLVPLEWCPLVYAFAPGLRCNAGRRALSVSVAC